MHREPQPVKLYTIGPMYRYAAPQRGRYREHWQLSVEAIGSDDPAIDAEVIQLYADSARTARASTAYELQLNSIGDPECRPALRRAAGRLARRARGRPRRRGAPEARDLPLRVFDTKNETLAGGARGRAEDRRVAVRRCQEHFDAVRGYLDAFGVSVSPRADARARARLLHAHHLRVRRTKRSAPSRRSAAAGATTASSRRSVASPRRASGSAPASSACARPRGDAHVGGPRRSTSSSCSRRVPIERLRSRR